jgi:hypothetical protein
VSQLKAMPGDTPDEFTDHNGHVRKLASRPDAGGLFKALPRFADHFPVFDKKDWQEIDRRAFDPVFGIFDQGQHGSCVGNGWAMGMSKARAIAGMKPLLLSPAFFYSLINGNQDEGAVISDGIAAGMSTGTCLFSTVGQDPIYQSRMPATAKAEAARFKLAKAYQVTSYADIITALLLPKPMIPVYGYMVGNNFERFDKYGVAGHDRGPGNHCNHADGVKLLPDGRWVLDNPNSWRKDWGPWGNGRVYLDEQHLFANGDQPDVCIVECVSDDPQDAGPPTAN